VVLVSSVVRTTLDFLSPRRLFCSLAPHTAVCIIFCSAYSSACSISTLSTLSTLSTSPFAFCLRRTSLYQYPNYVCTAQSQCPLETTDSPDLVGTPDIVGTVVGGWHQHDQTDTPLRFPVPAMSGNRAPPGFKSPYEPTPPGTVDPPGSKVSMYSFFKSGKTVSSVHSSWTVPMHPPTANNEYIPPPPPITEEMKNELPPPPPPPGSPPPHASVGRAPASLPFSAGMNRPRTQAPMNTGGSSGQTRRAYANGGRGSGNNGRGSANTGRGSANASRGSANTGGTSAVPGGASANNGSDATDTLWPHASREPEKFDRLTGAPLPSNNPPLLGNYPPHIDKCALTPHLLKSIRKSRRELKTMFKYDYGKYVLAKHLGDQSQMAVINARWASAVRRYIIRFIRYSRKVGTISTAGANKMNLTYRADNITTMEQGQLEFMLDLYPEELLCAAWRAEYITENYGKRPDDELAAKRDRKIEAHRQKLLDKAAKAYAKNKKFAAFANGERPAPSIPPWERVPPWNRPAHSNQNVQSAAANFSVQPVAANQGMPTGTPFYNAQPAASGAHYPVAQNYAVQPVAHGLANINLGGQSGGYTHGQNYGAQHGSYANNQNGNGYGARHSDYGNQHGSASRTQHSGYDNGYGSASGIQHSGFGNQHGSVPGNQYSSASRTQHSGFGTQPNGYGTQHANYPAPPSLHANNHTNSYHNAQHGNHGTQHGAYGQPIKPAYPPAQHGIFAPTHGTKRDYTGQPIKPSPAFSSSADDDTRYYSASGSFARGHGAQRGHGGTYIKPEPTDDEMEIDRASGRDVDVDMGEGGDDGTSMDISDDGIKSEDGDEEVYVKSEVAGSG
jgi:hypothetical protein